MIFPVRTSQYLVCLLMVVFISGVGCSGIDEEEEGEFEGAGSINLKGVRRRPLRGPGFLSIDRFRGESGGEALEVPQVMVDGLIIDGGLIDEPDFDSVVDGALFMVGDADDEGCSLVAGEVPRVVFCFAVWPEEVEFGEGLPGFWDGDDIDERSDDDDDKNSKEDGEGAVDSVFLSGEYDFLRKDEAFLRVYLFPSVDADQADAKDEEKEREEDGFKTDPPGGVIEEEADEGDDCDG